MASASLTPHCFEREKKKSRHGYPGHDMPKYFRRLPHGPADESKKTAPHPDKNDQGSGQPSLGALSHRFHVLFRQRIHLKISLRRNAERIGDAIEKRKHRGYVHCLGDLRLCPSMLTKRLHIFCGRAIPPQSPS
jgi:hypothetical protein